MARWASVILDCQPAPSCYYLLVFTQLSPPPSLSSIKSKKSRRGIQPLIESAGEELSSVIIRPEKSTRGRKSVSIVGTQGEGKPAKESVAIQVEKKAGKQANKKTEKQVEKKAKAALLRPKQAEPKRGTSYSAESLCKMTCLICNTGSPQSY